MPLPRRVWPAALAAALVGCQPQAPQSFAWPHDLTVRLKYANQHETCVQERVEVGLKGQPPAFSEVLSGETERTFTLKNVQREDWVRLDAHCPPEQERVIEVASSFPAKELTADRLVIFHTRLAGGGAEFGRHADSP